VGGDGLKLVLVQWVDSNCESGWQTTREALRDAGDNDLLCQTAGWVLEDVDRYLLIATSRTTSRSESKEQVCDVIQIPRGAIVSVHGLNPSRKLPS
jgi:hypothetical protein